MIIFTIIIKKLNYFFNIIISYLNFKAIVLFCTISYLIFFTLFAYFSYKAYLFSLNQLCQMNSFNIVNDISNLIYNFPLLNNNIQQIPNDAIQAIYNINGFHNYKEFIYPNNQNVELLHRMLNYDPDTASRYSSFIIQDIINNNSREIAELTEHLMKRLVKFSLPLGGLFITLIFLNVKEFDLISLLA